MASQYGTFPDGAQVTVIHPSTVFFCHTTGFVQSAHGLH